MNKTLSDVDILVDFDKPVSLLTVISLENYVSDLLEIKVDVVPKEDVNSWLRAMKTAMVSSEFAHALKSSLPDFLLSNDHDSLFKKIILDNADRDKMPELRMAA